MPPKQPEPDPLKAYTWSLSIEKPSRSNRMSDEQKSIAVISLMKHLDVSLHELLDWLFSSDLLLAKKRAGQWVSGNGQISPLRSLLENIWARYDQDVAAAAIDPIVCNVLEREGRAAIKCRDLSIRPGDIHLESMVSKLGTDADSIRNIVPALMPYSFRWLLHATSADNTYRARMKREEAAGASTSSAETQGSESVDGSLEADIVDDGDDFSTTGADWHTEFPRFSRNPRLAVTFSLCTLLHVRNRATNALPMCLATQMATHGANTRVTNTFSQLGAVVSRQTIDRFRVHLSVDAVARALNAARADTRWLAVIDNVDLHVTKASQRVVNQNYMIHLTNAAILLPHSSVPPTASNLSAFQDLRGLRISATPQDIMPSRDDDLHMIGAFEALVQSFLIDHTPGSKSWTNRQELSAQAAAAMPSIRPLPPEVTRTFPVGALDTEEGSIKGIIRALDLLRERLGMTKEEWGSDLHVIAGDYLTVRNMRSAQYLRSDDVGPVERLETILPQAQLFHFAMNAGDMILHHHLGDSVRDASSLSKHKDILMRTFDLNKIDFANTRALIKHSLISRILCGVAQLLGFSSWTELSTWRPTAEQLRDIAKKFVRAYATARAADDAQDAGDDVFAHNVLFIIDALIFFEFDSACAHGDAGRVIIVLKFWALEFRGAGRHNYARESAEVVIKWKFELNDDQRAMCAASWFVNRWGLPGRFIATDLYLEHLNFYVKIVHLADGSGVNVENIIKKGSACIEALREISLAVSQFVGSENRPRVSKEMKIEHDLETLFSFCFEEVSKLSTLPERQLLAPPPARRTKKKVHYPESSIQSLRSKGIVGWNGKWSEMLDSTTFDPQLGTVRYSEEGDSLPDSRVLTEQDLGLGISEDGAVGVGGDDYDVREDV